MWCQWPSYRQLRAVEGNGRERTRRPESSRSHSFYIPANRWTGPRPDWKTASGITDLCPHLHHWAKEKPKSR